MAEPETVAGHSGGLTSTFAETARLLASMHSAYEMLAGIVEAAVHYVPGCEYAGVTVIYREGQADSVAQSDPVVHESDALQSQLREGPCYDAIWERTTFRVDDMAQETRWPNYAPQAAQLGLGSALGFQLYTDKNTLGALDLYASAPHAFDDASEEIGTVFAAYATVALAWSRTEEQLHQAMHSRQALGEAAGVLMERDTLSPEQAFDVLRQNSNDAQTKLRDVAERVAETVEEPHIGRDSPVGLELVTAQLESLQRITAAFATAATAEQVTDELVRHAAESMDANVWVGFVDQSGEGLETAATVGYDSDVVASHRLIPMDAPLPLTRVASTGQPLWYPDAREAFARWPRLRDITADAASVALVPLDMGGRCLGALGLCFPRSRALPVTDRNYLLTLGRVGGQALSRARQYDSEHTIATTLQRALLPELPDLTTADVCARYHPANAGAQIGGDWYDVIALPQGRVGVVVGDVAGHNIDAAAVMGQMRSALRALAVSIEDPGQVVTELNALARDLSGMVMTTLFYGVWDPEDGTLGYVSAGHLSPLIKTSSGLVRFLYDSPSSMPVDVRRDASYTTAEAELKPGETLFGYTDGLIERRGESLEDGLARLTAALEATPYDDLDGICDDIRTRLHALQQEDDTALVALRPRVNEQQV